MVLWVHTPVDAALSKNCSGSNEYTEDKDEKALLKMKDIGNQFTGKDYDINFEWSDNKIYCSELIWKIYKRGAGLEIGKLEKIKDYDFTNPKVQQKAKERYGNNIPEEEMVISPVAIFNSPLLFTVASNE